MTTTETPCDGTNAAYQRHIERQEPNHPECRAAHAADSASRRKRVTPRTELEKSGGATADIVAAHIKALWSRDDRWAPEDPVSAGSFTVDVDGTVFEVSVTS
jgi:hypothetical protein